MSEFASISGVDVANIAKVSGKDIADVDKYADISKPAGGIQFVVNGLIAWWDPATQTVGDTVLDDLTYEGGLSTQDHYFNGGNGASIVSVDGTQAAYTDGVNDQWFCNRYSLYGTSDTFYIPTITPNQSIEIWFRSNGSFINNGNLFGAAYNNGVRSRFDSSGNFWVYFNSGSFAPNWQASTNTWYHLVLTVTNTATDEARLYINGSLQTEDTDIGGVIGTHTSGTMILGSYNSSSEKGRFYFGPMRRYNRPLTSTEVLQNYNAEKDRFGY